MYNILQIQGHRAKKVRQVKSIVDAINITIELQKQGQRVYYVKKKELVKN
jgi:hypothetical protein